MSKPDKAAENAALMRIGTAAAKAGVSRQTLQYYVMVDLIKPSSRSQAGQRLFGVRLEGNTAERGVDILAEAGARHHTLVKTYDGIIVTDGALTIDLVPSAPMADAAPPILSGVAVSVDD